MYFQARCDFFYLLYPRDLVKFNAWTSQRRLKSNFQVSHCTNILTFVYNKTGADSSEWFEPAEDASNQRHRNQPHRSKAGSSRRPNPERAPPVTGVVYIVTMRACLTQGAPPFGKVGSSSRPDNNCGARLGELQTGNPHQLACNHMFRVTGDLRTAEGRVHRQLRTDGLHIYQSCGGGREWYSFPGRGVQSLATRVRNILNSTGVLAPTSDWVESSINPSLSPNQSPQFVYNSKWRQVPCKGDELQHITYNCK